MTRISKHCLIKYYTLHIETLKRPRTMTDCTNWLYSINYNCNLPQITPLTTRIPFPFSSTSNHPQPFIHIVQ